MFSFARNLFKNISSVMIRTIFSDFFFLSRRGAEERCHMSMINLKSLGEIHGVRVTLYSQQDNVASLDCKRFTDFGYEAYRSTLKSG